MYSSYGESSCTTGAAAGVGLDTNIRTCQKEKKENHDVVSNTITAAVVQYNNRSAANKLTSRGVKAVDLSLSEKKQRIYIYTYRQSASKLKARETASSVWFAEASFFHSCTITYFMTRSQGVTQH